MKLLKPHISIIIPALNEAGTIGELLAFLKIYCLEDRILEIIIVDGGSADSTMEIAREMGCRVLQSPSGRAIQMNHGAREAKADILYFLHADTIPPVDFDLHIRKAVVSGHEAGCFRMRFDSKSLFLGFFSWFSRFNYCFCRGGDQSLFITKDVFRRSGGFNEAYRIYEDNEYVRRLYGITPFKVLPEFVTTSARRYRQMRMVKLQFHFAMMHLKNYLGYGPEELYRYYRRNISM